MIISYLILIVILGGTEAFSPLRAREKGCPPPEDVTPCLCYASPFAVLRCHNIDDTEALRNIFIRSSRYRYSEVHLQNAVLQFLPSDMFQGVEILELHFHNTTLVQLFDEPPSNLDMLELLHIENSNVFSGLTWDLFHPFKNLRTLRIYYNTIPTLEREFSDHVTKNLKQLYFYATETSFIQPGVLTGYVNLDSISFDDCEITELKRKIFPRPFNIKVIYFNKNKLTSIPDDLFTEMPRLQTVGLRHNELVTIPGSAFRGNHPRLQYFMLEGNPLSCDCRLEWLLEEKPEVLTGNCEAPSSLQGKSLRDLTKHDLDCPSINKIEI